MIESKTVLVTGSTDGIGKETAKSLAQEGATVLLHGRNKEKGANVLAAMKKETVNEKLAFYPGDFAFFADISAMAKTIIRDQPRLDILINNAGNFFNQYQTNEDGIEMTFAVNHLGPMLLTLLLVDLIKQSQPARIITIASSAHQSINGKDLEDILFKKNSYDRFKAYGISKLCNIYFTQELADMLQGEDIFVNSLHPGVIDTKLLRKSYKMEGSSLQEGASTSIFLARSDDGAQTTGKYFSRKKERNPSLLAQDETVQEMIWEKSMEMLKPYL